MLTHESSRETASLELVASRLAGYTGVQCESGVLARAEAGFARETAYVDITANSVQSALYAERKLIDIGGITADRWRTGWSELEGRRLGIRIYLS